MNIEAKDFEDLISKIEYLDNESTIRFNINNKNLKYSIIIKNAKFNFTGNASMFVNGSIEITIEGLDFLHNKVVIPVEMSEYYLKLLNNTMNESVVHSIKLLMKEQLKIGDTIEWENGRVGIITEPKTFHNGQIYYRLLKKNGELGAKEFVLYGRTKEYNYKCKNREFIDYNMFK